MTEKKLFIVENQYCRDKFPLYHEAKKNWSLVIEHAQFFLDLTGDFAQMNTTSMGFRVQFGGGGGVIGDAF